MSPFFVDENYRIPFNLKDPNAMSNSSFPV